MSKTVQDIMSLVDYNFWPFGWMPAAAMIFTIWEYSKAAILKRNSKMNPFSLASLSAPSVVVAAAWCVGLTAPTDLTFGNFLLLQVLGGLVFVFSFFVLSSSSSQKNQSLLSMNSRSSRQKLLAAGRATLLFGAIIFGYYQVQPFVASPPLCLSLRCRAARFLIGGSSESGLGVLWVLSLFGSMACGAFLVMIRSVLGSFRTE